jgi:CRISPR-associated endonuclease/helicase Cas3
MSGSDSTPLAKGEPVSFWELRRSRAIAGVPQRWRHEAATACNLTDLPLLDDRLVNWLIHTHHGHGRPFWPHCDDPSVPLQTTFDPDWVDIRDDLTAKYGPWRLSLLESVVRCADWVGSHQRSEQSATAPKETT